VVATLSVMTVLVEMPEIVLAPVMVLVPVPEIVLAV